MQIESIALMRLAAAAALLQMSISAASAAPTAASAADTPAASSAAPAEGPLSHDEIREAVAKLAGDSNLAGRQKSRELRWRQSQAPPADTPSWAGGFLGFLAQESLRPAAICYRQSRVDRRKNQLKSRKIWLPTLAKLDKLSDYP